MPAMGRHGSNLIRRMEILLKIGGALYGPVGYFVLHEDGQCYGRPDEHHSPQMNF
jgi:hypothetical protein